MYGRRIMKKIKSDLDLRQDVLDELEFEPSINAAQIGVSVKDGIVTLTGHVSTYAEKRTAEISAMRVAGVKAVVEDIEVRLAQNGIRSDEDIAKAVLNALRWNVFLSENDIKVKVENGIVTLEGEVDWQYRKEKAVDVVRNLTGVRFVNNRILLRSKVTPLGVKDKIRKALERTADEDADHIHVTVHDSDVTLSGDVRARMEREMAERAAWAAPGVMKVINQIRIRPQVYA